MPGIPGDLLDAILRQRADLHQRIPLVPGVVVQPDPAVAREALVFGDANQLEQRLFVQRRVCP